MLRRSVSIKLGLRELKLARQGSARALTPEQARVNRRAALELDLATDWFDARDSAQLIELLGSNVSDQLGPRSVRSQRLIIERLRDRLKSALRSGDVIAEEAPARPALTEREEPPPELRRPPPPSGNPPPLAAHPSRAPALRQESNRATSQLASALATDRSIEKDPHSEVG